MLKPKRMDLIDLSIGLRRSQDKKMEPSKEKCGRVPPDTSATGETTAKKDLESNSTPKATSTKACGPWTRSTVKVLIGAMKVANYEESIPVIGLKIKSMVAVHSFSKTVTDTMATGSTECPKEKVE